MGRVVKVQTNFTVGEVNPELRGRIDLNQFESALERARNVIINPRGIVDRRFGSKFVLEIPSAATPASGTRLVPFQFSTTQTYMFLFSSTRAYIFKDGVLVTNINSTGNDFLDCSSSVSGVTDGITSARLTDLWWAQSADTLLLFEETMKSLKIVRGGADNAWTVSDITFDNIPLYLFTASESNPSATLTPSATDGNVTLTASSGVFVAGDVGQKVFDNSTGIGLARIVGFTSSTVVEATTETPFFNTDAIASGAWTLQKGWEDAWSNTRGWPRTATFHEGRLIAGGSKSLPSTVWGSKVGQFFDFDLSQSLDDEALEATIDTDQVNAVTAIMSGRELQLFTTGTEFTVPQLEGEPLTPTSFLFKPTTRRGSVLGVRPQMTEGGTLYLQRGGKAVRELIFSDVEGSFISNDISLLSSHLLQSPTRIVQRRGTNVDDGDLLLVRNGGTGVYAGSVAAFSILRAQNVVAPSLITTVGSIEELGIEDADTPLIYGVIKRELYTFTITVTDAGNIQPGSTITFKDHAGTEITLTATADDPPTGETATAIKFSTGDGSNNGVADNIAIGSGGVFGINSLEGFSAPNPSANVVTVTRSISGGDNLTVTSSDPTRLAVTNFAVSSTSYHVDVFDSNFTTDSAKQFSGGTLPSSTTVTGLSHLESRRVKVIADDAELEDQTVVSGQITIDRVPSTFLEIGLEFPTFKDELKNDMVKATPLIRTMPVETRLPSGPVIGFKKRIVNVNAVLNDTQNLVINGDSLPFRKLDDDILDSGIEFFTGTKRSGAFLGYDYDGQIEITQDAPLFFTLLALDYRVSVGQ